jgi:hypothetical protein
MPRLQKAMKDAVWRRYASGRCQATFDPEISEWDNPVERTSIISLRNGLEKQTSGSETSQYREEKKPIGIPLVAASETGGAQTQPLT